jgi:RNA polymerase sigma factor (TIGR02999 family)
MTQRSEQINDLIERMRDQPPAEVAAALLPLVYDDLRDVARNYLRGERKGHTLQPTALVHEAFQRLVDQSRVNWQGKSHFLAVGAEAMRRVLLDHARSRKRAKRGGGWQKVAVEDVAAPGGSTEINLITLSDALEKLRTLDADEARVVELRVLSGLSVAEVAEVLGVSKRKVEGDWTHAKAWLQAELATDLQA